MCHRNSLTLSLALAVLLSVRSALGQAGSEEPPSPAAAVELYRSAAQLQNTGVYELAVDEWSALLERFPQDALATSARHNRGICLFQLRKYEEAAADFTAVSRGAGQFDQLESTLVNLGLAYFNLAQRSGADSDQAQEREALLTEALKAFDRQLQEFPRGAHAALARYYRAESLYAAGEGERAIEAYQTYLKEHADGEHVPLVLYGLAVVQAEEGCHAEAEAALRRFLMKYPQHEFAAEVQMRLGDALFAQGKYAEAAPQFAAASAQDSFALADYALLRQAAALFEQGSFADAAGLYASLVERFPRSSHAAAAKLNAGKAFLRAGDAARAAQWFRATVNAGEESVDEAAHWLSRSLLARGTAAEALASADAALSRQPDEEWIVELMLDRADAAYELEGRREEALSGYAAVADRFPDHPRAPWARYSAADLALSLGHLDDARDHARMLLQSSPQSEYAADAQFVLAEVARLRGEHEAAAEAFAELIAEHPENADRALWINRLALTHLMADDSKSVVTTLGPLVESYGEGLLKGEAEYLLGTAYLRLGEFDNAVRYLARAVRAPGEKAYLAAATINLARAQHGAGADREAVDTLRNFTGSFEGSPFAAEATYRLGVFEAAAENHAAALAAFERVVSEWPQSPFVPHALYAAATAHRGENDLAGAKAALDRLLNAFANHETTAPALLLRASVLRDLGNPAAALQDLAKYLGGPLSDEERADALYLQGLCQAALEDFDAAIATYAELLAKHPTYASADRVLYEMAWAHKDSGDDENAREAFSLLGERFPTSDLAAEALFRVGESFYDAKDFASAAKAYAASASAKPPAEIHEKALHKEGWAYFHVGNFAAAAQRFARQVEAFPAGVLALDARVMRAECLFQRKEYAEALARFEEVLPAVGASRSLQTIALLHAGQAAGQTKAWEKALDLLERCAKRFPESEYRHEVQYETGWAKYHLGRHDEAARDFSAVSAEHSGVLGVRAQFMLGEIQMGKKEYEDAVRTFYRVAFGHGYPDAPQEYHSWQAAAMFDAARCLEQLGKQDAANKLYHDLVATFPDQEQAAHARKRLEELGS